MISRYVLSIAAALGTGVFLTSGTIAQNPPEEGVGVFDRTEVIKSAAARPEVPEGIEPLAKGPVHGAFADPANNMVPKPTPVIPKKPPAPIEELPPEQKPEGDNVQWISGHWAWDEDRADFLWVSGIWRAVPPGRQWMPGHWDEVEGGWQWTPGFWGVAGQEEITVVPTPPPEPIVEAEPPQPSEDTVYIPGNWVYHETRYVWRPGFWCGYRPGWVWIPAQWVWTPAGCTYVEGYWDYVLADRGLLFSPCYIQPQVYLNPGFTYTPSYVVHDYFLMGSLFLRPRWSCYYFGDYFDFSYQRAGFVSWLGFRYGGGWRDPLFNYYRCRYRNNPGWERDLYGLYDGRFRGVIDRPPVNIFQQNTVINNTNITKNVNITNIKNSVVLAPITQVNQQKVKLTRLDEARRQLEIKESQQLRDLARQRSQAAKQALARAGDGPDRKVDSPRTLKLDLPKGLADRVADRGKGAAAGKQPPPPPIAIRTGDRPGSLPRVDVKPDGVKPGDVQRPGDRVPIQPKADVKPGGVKPGDIQRPGDRVPIQPKADVKPGGVKPGDIQKPGDRVPIQPKADVKPGGVKPGDIQKPGDRVPIQPKADVKPGDKPASPFGGQRLPGQGAGQPRIGDRVPIQPKADVKPGGVKPGDVQNPGGRVPVQPKADVKPSDKPASPFGGQRLPDRGIGQPRIGDRLDRSGGLPGSVKPLDRSGDSKPRDVTKPPSKPPSAGSIPDRFPSVAVPGSTPGRGRDIDAFRGTTITPRGQTDRPSTGGRAPSIDRPTIVTPKGSDSIGRTPGRLGSPPPSRSGGVLAQPPARLSSPPAFRSGGNINRPPAQRSSPPAIKNFGNVNRAPPKISSPPAGGKSFRSVSPQGGGSRPSGFQRGGPSRGGKGRG